MADSSLAAVGVHIYAGGFTLGVERHFNVVAHLETSSYGVSTARLNFPRFPIYEPKSAWPCATALRDAGGGTIDLVYANPPCAIFSPLGSITRHGPNGWKSDKRLACWYEVISLAEAVEARIYVIESVTQAWTRGRKLIDAMTRRALERGYSVTIVLVNAKWYGLAQARKRFFFVACRASMPLALQPINYDTPLRTVDEVLDSVASDPGEHEPIKRADIIEILRTLPPDSGLQKAWELRNPGFEKRLNSAGNVAGRPRFCEYRLPIDRQMGVFLGNFYYHPTEHRRLGANEQKALCGYPITFTTDKKIGDLGALLARAVMPPVAEWLAASIRATLTQPQLVTRYTPTVTLADVSRPGQPLVDLTPDYAANATSIAQLDLFLSEEDVAARGGAA